MTSYSRVHRSRRFSPMGQSISGSLALAAVRYRPRERAKRDGGSAFGAAENPGDANGPTRPVHRRTLCTRSAPLRLGVLVN